MRVGVAVVDLFTGLYTCVAILSALLRREKTGEGAHIDMALFDTQLAMLANQASNALVSGKDPPRQGNTHPNIVPYQPFDAADQPIIIAVGNDRQFARLAQMCGHPEWISDERFASNGSRVANRGAIVELISDCIRKKPAAEWLEQLERAGIPAGPINTITRALSGRSGAAPRRRADDCGHAPRRRACAARRRAWIQTCHRRNSASTRMKCWRASGLSRPAWSGSSPKAWLASSPYLLALWTSRSSWCWQPCSIRTCAVPTMSFAASGTVTKLTLLLSPVSGHSI